MPFKQNTNSRTFEVLFFGENKGCLWNRQNFFFGNNTSSVVSDVKCSFFMSAAFLIRWQCYVMLNSGFRIRIDLMQIRIRIRIQHFF
jgi:hypothetical protein